MASRAVVRPSISVGRKLTAVLAIASGEPHLPISMARRML